MSPMPGAVGGVGSSPASSTLGGGVEQAPALVQTTVATGPSAGASVPMVPEPIHEHGIDDDDEAMPLVCDVDTCDGEEALPLPGKNRQRQPTPVEAKLRSPGSGDDDELLPDLDDALTCRTRQKKKERKSHHLPRSICTSGASDPGGVLRLSLPVH